MCGMLFSPAFVSSPQLLALDCNLTHKFVGDLYLYRSPPSLQRIIGIQSLKVLEALSKLIFILSSRPKARVYLLLIVIAVTIIIIVMMALE